MRIFARFLAILTPAVAVLVTTTGLYGSIAADQETVSLATSLWALCLCFSILLTFIVLSFMAVTEPRRAEVATMIVVSLTAALATIFVAATMPEQRTMLSMVFAGGMMVLLTQSLVRRSSPAHL